MSESLKNVLIVVTADPHTSGRAAEAVRIAAGIGGWEKVAVKVCLCGKARHLLLDGAEDYVNGEIFTAYLPVLLEGEPKVFALADEAFTGFSGGKVQTVTVSQLAALGREADSVLRF
jgi:hypothetical protein